MIQFFIFVFAYITSQNEVRDLRGRVQFFLAFLTTSVENTKRLQISLQEN